MPRMQPISAVILGLVVLATAGAVYYWQKQQPVSSRKPTPPATQQQTQPVNQAPAVSNQQLDTSSLAGWKTYRNEEYGFKVKYPAQSTIRVYDDQGYKKIRLQNYNFSTQVATEGLALGEYYLEIFIDDRQPKDTFSRCKNQLIDSKEVKVGTTIGYRGMVDVGGDAGGIPFVLCVQKGGVFVEFSVTENDSKGPVANAILDTVSF